MSQTKTLLVLNVFAILLIGISGFAEESLDECLQSKKVEAVQCEKNVLLRGIELSNRLDQLQISSHRGCGDCQKNLDELEQQYEDLLPELSEIASSDYRAADPEYVADAINMMVGLHGQIEEIKKILRPTNSSTYEKYAKK
jgi:hypothetical protein